jgi:hypothetical protein
MRIVQKIPHPILALGTPDVKKFLKIGYAISSHNGIIITRRIVFLIKNKALYRVSPKYH